MKTIAFLLLLAASPLFAQTSLDRIQKRDNSFIEGKVLKISGDQIEYKNAANLEGPTYTLHKSEVYSITYSNGYQEVFSPPVQSTVNTAQVTNTEMQPVEPSSVMTSNVSESLRYQGISRREPAVAGIFSFLIPGAGQLYNRQYGKSAATFGGYALSVILAVRSARKARVESIYDIWTGGYYGETPDYTGTYVALAAAVGINIYSIIDGVISAKKINQRYGLSSRLKLEPTTNFALNAQGNLSPVWGAKVTYKLY